MRVCVCVCGYQEYPVCVRRQQGGLFVYRIYEEFHINLWECLIYGY